MRGTATKLVSVQEFTNGDITLSQAFTNFTWLIIIASDDNLAYSHDIHVIPVSLLDNKLNYSNTYWYGGSTTTSVFFNTRDYWLLKSYSQGSTTTTLKHNSDNCVIHSIWGVK